MARKGSTPMAFMASITGDEQSSPREKPFAQPSDVENFAGFGATDEDLQRGFLATPITNDPKYDKANYVDRSSVPNTSDNDEGGSPVLEDFQFRMKDRVSNGFLTRPRIPTER